MRGHYMRWVSPRLRNKFCIARHTLTGSTSDERNAQPAAIRLSHWEAVAEVGLQNT